MFSLKNKVSVVTGASRGIGKSIAKIYAKAGAHVCCISRNKDTLDDVVESIVSNGGSASINAFDVSKSIEFHDNINNIVKKMNVPKKLGLLSLDIDGVDYWVLKELSILDPSIIICEFPLPNP